MLRVPSYESDLQPTTLIWADNSFFFQPRIQLLKQGVPSRIHKTCVSTAHVSILKMQPPPQPLPTLSLALTS